MYLIALLLHSLTGSGLNSHYGSHISSISRLAPIVRSGCEGRL